MAILYPDGSYLTIKGNTLIGKLLASRGPLNFTRATVGSGVLADGLSPAEVTDLVSYKVDGHIASVDNPQNGEASVLVQVFSNNVMVGFSATELMLWAEDPDEGEIPYTYLKLTENPEWIRPQSDPVQKLATFELVVIVSSIAIVTATINPLALARAVDLSTHIGKYVMSQNGAHGIRHVDGDLEVYDEAAEEWVKAVDVLIDLMRIFRATATDGESVLIGYDPATDSVFGFPLSRVSVRAFRLNGGDPSMELTDYPDGTLDGGDPSMELTDYPDGTLSGGDPFTL